jgi:non-specific serine/threonine protein kinase
VQQVRAHRLVTLSGSPGVGKTRLGLRVAAELRDDFADGVWVVELAALTDPDLVPSTIAAVLGLREDSHRSPSESLASALLTEQMLLVLDNCEHLTDACAALAALLLQSCPDVRVLTMSREPLELAGETCWPVEPLAAPDPVVLSAGPGLAGTSFGEHPSIDTLLASEAGRLFVERARAVRPGLILTDESALAMARICRQLDGIPLAIELAAARVAAFSPVEISARLDDRLAFLARAGRTAPPHQRTLRESIEWSHGLLSEPERILLRRLSIFRGGWSLEAAERVGSGQFKADELVADEFGETSFNSSAGLLRTRLPTLDVLASLVTRSLVVAEQRGGETRYTYLETIRQYAEQRLREAGEEAALARWHRDWCIALVESAATYLRSPEQAAWRDRLTREYDNLQVALGRTIEGNDAEPGLRICVSLWHYWSDNGNARQGLGWLTRLLALESASGRTTLRAAGLFLAAKMAFEGGDLPTALALGRESLAIAREVGDPHTLHRTLTQLGHIARGRGEWLVARRYYEEALPIRRELGEPVDVAVSLACLGHCARALAEYDKARALYEESLDLAVKQGHPAEITATQHDIGRLAADQGRYDEAARWFTEALSTASRLNHPRRIAYLLERFAGLAVARKQPQRALRLAGAAAALRLTSGSALPPIEQEALDDELASARRLLSNGRDLSAWDAGTALTTEQAVALALSPMLATPEPLPSALADPSDLPASLTSREREVVALVGQGFSNRQIAQALVISERTAEWHVANSLGKLGLSTRAQLAVWVSRHGLTSSPSVATSIVDGHPPQ